MLVLILAVFTFVSVKDLDYLKLILLCMSCFFTYLMPKQNLVCGDFVFLIVNRRVRGSK